MADTPTLKPKLQLLIELMKSPVLLALVTGLLGGTLATQRMTAPPPKVEAVKAPDLSPILAELVDLRERVILIEGYSSLAVDRLLQLGDDPRTPRAAVKKLVRPLPKAIDTSTR